MQVTGTDSAYPLNIVCAYWGNWCDGLGRTYVEHLCNSVRRHLTLPYQMFCLTDHAEELDGVDDITILPILNPSQLGIIPKLSVYNPEYNWKGRIIVMDLDTIVMGSLDTIFSYDGAFACRGRFSSSDNFFDGIGGDMLGFPAGFGIDEIWQPLVKDTKAFEAISKRGDERVIYQHWLYNRGINIDFWQDVYPGCYCSYKVHILKNHWARPPERVSLVSFHGNPRPHEIHGKKWIDDNWR